MSSCHLVTHSNHVTSSKWADNLDCHTTMLRNPIYFLYNLDHVTLWCVDVGPVANVREGSTREHDRARVIWWLLVQEQTSVQSVCGEQIYFSVSISEGFILTKTTNLLSTEWLNMGLLLFLLYTRHLTLIWWIFTGLPLELFWTRK